MTSFSSFFSYLFYFSTPMLFLPTLAFDLIFLLQFLGHYEPPTIGSQPLNPQTATTSLDKSRVLVHWNQEPDKGGKSDEDDEEEDGKFQKDILYLFCYKTGVYLSNITT